MKKYIKKLREDYKNNEDYKFKYIKIKLTKIYIIFNEVLTSSDYVNEYILKPLIYMKKTKYLDYYIPTTNIITITFDEIDTYIHMGYLIIIADKIYAIEAKEKLDRGIQQIDSELSIKGPKDAFLENFNKNLGLIRKRIKSKDLIVEKLQIGLATKTIVGVMYMNNIVDNSSVNIVKHKLNKINIDGIIDSTYLKTILESKYTFFPTIISTERPDKATMALLEGKIIILVDMSPYALIMPVFLIDFFHTNDDYYQKPINTSFIRIIRLLAFIIAILTPALYLAVTTHNFDLVPLNFLLSLKAQRQSVPFPALIEALLMSISFEILRESDIRMSATTGSAVSILGGLILGDAAVAAGIISPIMIIVIAISAISGLVFTSIELVSAIRWLRFIILILGAFFGIEGIIIGFSILIIRLLLLKSINKPYLYPFFPFSFKAQKDSILKVDTNIRYRNELLTKNKIRGWYK